MERTYLIQRLDQPAGFSNPFSFGVGGSGLSKDAEDLVAKVWSWDYMGSAEFEFGAAQKSLAKIAGYVREEKVVTGTVALPGDHEVYFLAEKGTELEIEQRITQLYHDESSMRLLERCRLRNHLDGKEYAKRHAGWLELDNGFLFFADREMYQNALRLLGYQQDER